jgi:hypothetical protein
MESPELQNFYIAIQNFREVKEGDLPLNDFELICLENYISLLQITYIEWERRNSQAPSYQRAA